jgi:hypothetical protein
MQERPSILAQTEMLLTHLDVHLASVRASTILNAVFMVYHSPPFTYLNGTSVLRSYSQILPISALFYHAHSQASLSVAVNCQ